MGRNGPGSGMHGVYEDVGLGAKAGSDRHGTYDDGVAGSGSATAYGSLGTSGAGAACLGDAWPTAASFTFRSRRGGTCTSLFKPSTYTRLGGVHVSPRASSCAMNALAGRGMHTDCYQLLACCARRVTHARALLQPMRSGRAVSPHTVPSRPCAPSAPLCSSGYGSSARGHLTVPRHLLHHRMRVHGPDKRMSRGASSPTGAARPCAHTHFACDFQVDVG
jgi:hypothetical protein